MNYSLNFRSAALLAALLYAQLAGGAPLTIGPSPLYLSSSVPPLVTYRFTAWVRLFVRRIETSAAG